MEDEQIESYKRQAIGMLLNYNDNKIQIEMLKSKIKEASRRTDITDLAVSYDQPSGGRTNKVTSTIELSLMKKEQEMERLENELIRLEGEIERIDIALDNLPYAQRMLLKMKYIDKCYWQEVADAINYDVYYTKKELKNKALSTFAGYLFSEVYMVNLFETPHPNHT